MLRRRSHSRLPRDLRATARSNGIGFASVPGYARRVPTIDDWNDLDVRVGTVLRAEPNDGARDPSYKLWIDFGDHGELQSSAKITDHYSPSDLVGRQVIAVTGFGSMRVGGFRSDVLVLGAVTEGGVILLGVDQAVDPGTGVA